MNELSKAEMPSVKVWNNQRVVTFKDIDKVHQRPEGTAKRNYNKNKKHFIENEDFYKITPDEVLPTIRKHGMYAIDELIT